MRKKAELLSVGQITSTHGLKGEVKVYPTTDDPRKRFLELKKAIIKTPGEEVEVTIGSVRFMKNLALLTFEELPGIEAVEKYRNGYICVRREDAAPLGENEYYETDLIGMDVISEDGDRIGTLTRVYHTGANDCYEIETDSREHKSTLIPAIRECIKDVDVESGVMTIHIMEGLFT